MNWLLVHAPDGIPVVSVARADDLGYVVRVHHVADFSIAGDGELRGSERAPDVSAQEATEAFDMLVRPTLHQLRGRPALHASAVEIDGGFVAFMGATRAGKSTLAALLCDRYPLVADDCLPLEPDGDGFLATPSSHHVRLRNETAPRFGVEPNAWVKPRLAVAHAKERRRLVRIYAIGSAANVATITRLSRKAALLEVAPRLHRLDPERPDLLRTELGYLERLTAAVPVAKLSYPRTYAGTDAIAAAIAEDLRRPA